MVQGRRWSKAEVSAEKRSQEEWREGLRHTKRLPVSQLRPRFWLHPSNIPASRVNRPHAGTSHFLLLLL